MSDYRKPETPLTTDDVPDPNEEKHAFSETAMGLGRAVGKVTLTPVVGLGLMGVAAEDAIESGAVGAFHKASDMLENPDENSSKEMEKAGVDSEPQLGELEIEEFDIESADYKKLRKEYVDKGIPFILKHADGSPISEAGPPEQTSDKSDSQQAGEGNIHVTADSMKRKLEGIDEIVHKLLPRTFRAYWPLWFQGNYKSGLAHVDLGPGTCNFYWMKQGSKDVVIAPYRTTRNLTLKSGIDNLYIPGSAGGNHDYLEDLDVYYRTKIPEGSLLIFNNSGCLHHFTNLVEDEGVTPIALSVRCKHSLGSDPRGWVNLAANLKVWWGMTDHVMNLSGDASEARPQEKM